MGVEKTLHPYSSNQERTEITRLILDKNKLQIKAIKCTKRMLYIDKRVNIPRSYNNYKHKCTKHQSSKTYKIDIGRINNSNREKGEIGRRRNRQFYKNS
jgi:hypothetical protein